MAGDIEPVKKRRKKEIDVAAAALSVPVISPGWTTYGIGWLGQMIPRPRTVQSTPAYQMFIYSQLQYNPAPLAKDS